MDNASHHQTAPAPRYHGLSGRYAWRGIVMGLLLAAVSACSNTFIYNQLDWLIPWYLGDYVDLDRDQGRTLKSRLRDLLQWHRSEELTQYLVFLDEVETDLDSTLSGTDIERWANRAEAAYDRLEARMLPIAFDLGAELTDEQMSGFLVELAERQKALEKEYLQRSDAEYREDAAESLTDTFEDLMGRLNDLQQQEIAEAVGRLQRFDAGWLAERAQWLETLNGELQQRNQGWQDRIRQALADRERNRTDSYRGAYRHNALIVNQVIADVLNLRSPKQDARLRDEIAGYRRDFRKLIAQGEG
ncbi:MAG: DUF6279 family lipoprotein [Halieaceae bacterium]|jgi:hypothetical protein|nr:DUF6279 family lipoprotein [Halieaceae bacterium]